MSDETSFHAIMTEAILDSGREMAIPCWGGFLDLRPLREGGAAYSFFDSLFTKYLGVSIEDVVVYSSAQGSKDTVFDVISFVKQDGTKGSVSPEDIRVNASPDVYQIKAIAVYEWHGCPVLVLRDSHHGDESYNVFAPERVPAPENAFKM
jgi:hypothetical protein